MPGGSASSTVLCGSTRTDCHGIEGYARDQPASTAPETGTTFWSTGSPLQSETPFVFWHEDEPNNSGDEDCGAMGFPHGVWFDVDTNHLAPYFVEFETAGITDDVFTQVGLVGANVTSFTDLTVAAGQRWEYRVVAVGAQAPSTPSNVVAATIP